MRVGLLLVAIVFAAGILGPILTTDPDATDYAAQLVPPSSAHWLGTDGAGRDVLARVFTATRTSLADAVIVSVLTALIGVFVGGTAGLVRGPVDAVLSRVVDVLLGLPELVIALAIVGALGVGHLNLLLALVLSGWAYPARITRGLVLGAHSRGDVVSARLAGVGEARILVGHVLPGVIAQVFVVMATGFGSVVISLAGLSFLGLGAQPPAAELGSMIEESRGDLAIAPWLAVGPTAVIALTVTAALLVSESLRDALSTGTRSKHQQQGDDAQPAPGSAVPLRIRDLHITYADGTAAVRGVDLDVAAGECVALIGESGCGKTTLARALLQLLPADTLVTGRAEVGGLALPTGGPALHRLRGRVAGFVAQDPFATFDPLRSVGDHLREAWRVHRTPVPGDLAGRLTRLGIPDAGRRMRDRPFRWSGGMLQRASIAAATAHDPVLVVADEPTSAVDAHLADEALATLRAAGRAVLLISHDLRVVARHSDRVVVMRDGAVVETGLSADVVERPRAEYTRLLLAASP